MDNLQARVQATLGSGYVVERELGGGGMSRVFVVEEVALARRIAVKVLSPELVADVSIGRFQREVAIAARLQHPHIVPLLTTGETDGLPYYTMPFIDGESLRERLSRSGPVAVGDAMRWMREIAAALAHAHDRGVVHRDIKPENVLLSGGIALVTDFGVAKAIAASTTLRGATLTSAGVAVGTPAYMSPEQASGEAMVDHRADVYSLGMIAYEMLAGQTPFAGRSVQAVLAAQVIDTPEPIQQRRSGIPPALAALVMRCLAKSPGDRPQNAADVMHALDAMTIPAASTHGLNRRTRLLAVAAALVVVAVSATWFVRHRAGATPMATTPSRVLVAPFENLTGDPRYDHVGRIAADRLAGSVGEASSVEVVPSSIVLMSLRDTTGGLASRLAKLSDATNAGLIVSGSVVLRGDSLSLQAQMTSARTGKVVASLGPMTGAASDPIAVVDALGDRLLGALGSRDITILPQQGFRAPKYAAYQEFALGFEQFAVYADFIGSRKHFERAIAIDPNYTRAYQLLGRQYLNSGEYARADSMARTIEQLPQGLTAAERLTLDYMKAELRGDVEGLLRAQQQLAARDSSPLALALTGEAALWLLRPGMALPALERSWPAYSLLGGNAARQHILMFADAYHQSGAYDRELRVLVDNAAFLADPNERRGRRLHALAGLSRQADALQLADSILRGSESSTVTLSQLAIGAEEFQAHGDAATRAKLLELTRRWLAAHPVRTPSTSRSLWEGIVFLGSGMTDSALSRLDRAARDTMSIDGAGYRALAMIARGDSSRARSIADSLGAMRRPWMFGTNTYWRAAILGALGERDLAVQLLRQSQHEGRDMTEWHHETALASLHGFPAFEALVKPVR